MRYLVTGASGFAGGYLVEALLSSGHEVFSLVRREGSAPDGSHEILADPLDTEAVAQAVKTAAPDGIYHLGAIHTSVGQSWKVPAAAISETVQATTTILDAARAHAPKARILLVSSAEVLGNVPEADQPIAEDVDPRPDTPYGLGKHLGEEAAEFYMRHFDSQVITVRPFNHIGPGQRPNFALASFAAQIAEIEQADGGAIKVGNLSARRDFTDVRDMVQAYVCLMEKGSAGEVYHAGSGTVRSIEEVLQLMVAASPASIEVTVDPERVRPVDTPLLSVDASKLRGLGWKPEIPLEQTVNDILVAARGA